MDRPDFARRVQRGFLQIVLYYAAFGTAWILGTDFLVARTFHYGDARLIELAKGLFYVLVTAVMLLILLMRLKGTLMNAYAARSTARQRLFAIVDSPLIGIAVWHVDGRLLEVNDTFLKLWGYTQEQFAAESPTFDMLSPPEYRERDLACLQAAVTENVPGPYVKELLRRDGSRMPVLTGVTASSPAAIEGMLFLLDDTDRRRAVEEREKVLADLESIVELRTKALDLANKDLESFSYSVSHDLRAPLRSIDGMAAAAEASLPQDLDEARHSLSRIHSNVKRMSGLIDSLLRLAQISRKPLRQERVDVALLAQAISEELQEANPSRQVKISVQPGLELMGDPELLRVAFKNLLENAWKFTSGRPDAEVQVTGDGSSISVCDNGMGFESTMADRIFLPFSRLHGTEAIQGSGIGLAMVERIIRGHGWRIEGIGHPGDGAEFRIYFANAASGAGTSNHSEPV